MYILPTKVSVGLRRLVQDMLNISTNRKIRCDGAEPCTNCSKSGRGCDYTPVPADVNAIRRRKGFGDATQSVVTTVRSTSEGPSRSHAERIPDAQRLPETGPSHPLITADQASAVPNAQDSRCIPTDIETREALLPSGFSYGPPPQGPSRMEWALVPVWRSTQPDQPPAPSLVPSSQGFAASRGAGAMAIPPPLMSGIERVTQDLQTPQQLSRISGYSAHSLEDEGHLGGLSAALFPVQRPIYRPSSAETMQTTGFLISEQAMPVPQAYRSEASSTTGTSLSSSHEHVGSMSTHTCSSTTTSPPYTPLPPSTGGTSTRSFTPNAPLNAAQTFAPEELKHIYPNAPLMFTNVPPTTPGFAIHSDTSPRSGAVTSATWTTS